MKTPFCFIVLLTAALWGHSAFCQQEKPGKCFSEQYMQSVAKAPAYSLSIEKSHRLLNQELNKRLLRKNRYPELAESSLPVTIPVVVHIVLENPSTVTDLEVQQQIDKLNRDFGGRNADSMNISPMFPYSLRGHSKIQFALAGKDPKGNFTTGIERRCSDTRFSGEETDEIKITASGGLDAWDPNRYVNIWVGESNIPSILGYSSYPYSIAGYTRPPLSFFGICIRRGAFGNSTSVSFNRGRTLVHEMGHYFGLFHSFQGDCGDEDFSLGTFDTTSIDDTPPQANATGTGAAVSCPSGDISSGCLGSTDGRLYQNFMDYTDDPCMTMFTVNQVLRMETALDIFLPSLRHSDAVFPPVSKGNDIEMLAALQPYAGAATYWDCMAHPLNKFCSDGESVTVSPVLKIRNAGSNVLGDLEIWYSIDAGIPQLNKSFQLYQPLNYLDTVSVTLDPIGFENGNHVLKIFSRYPNATVDERTENDTLSISVAVSLPSKFPVSESFETGFPPQDWTLVNNDEDHYSWEKTAVGKSGTASVFMNFFDYDRPGSIDDLVTPILNIANADSILFDFQRAYKLFDSTVTDFSDTLEIQLVEDCGALTKTIWKKGGAELGTVPGETGFINWQPDSTEWIKTSLDLRSLVSPGATTIQIVFRAKNGYGQNLYLDDINLRSSFKPIRDVAILSVNKPDGRSCDKWITPSLVIQNLGENRLKTLEISYAIDGKTPVTIQWEGDMRKFLKDTVRFEPVFVANPGSYRILYTGRLPNGFADENPSNDSIKTSFTVFEVQSLPVTEGFESTTFPPRGWGMKMADSVFTWKRTNSASTEKYYSAMSPNRLNENQGAVDELVSPVYTFNMVDSVMVSFDVAHVTEMFPAPAYSPTDTLEILVTTDCSQTFTSVYKKWGDALNTLLTPFPGASTRDSAGFTPDNKEQWKSDSVNITRVVGTAGQFQLVFRSINNNDNNLFLDNIRVKPVILPAKLKSTGYQLVPNPTTGLFFIRHYKLPLNLQAVHVVNGNGQLILQKNYQGNAPVSIPIDLSAHPAGIYTVRMKYGNELITERIIKVK